jgi:hypothetical protein
VRFDVMSIGLRGEIRRARAWYSENVLPAHLDALREMAAGPPAEGIALDGLLPGLRLDWTPDADGTALASLFAGPDAADVVLTCALLPKGRGEAAAIRDGIQAIVEEASRSMNLTPAFDASGLPEGPTVVSLVWPNVKHRAALGIVAGVQAALAAVWFLSRRPGGGRGGPG